MSEIRGTVGLWVFILLGLFLWKPGIGFADMSAYERSETRIKKQLRIIEKELARNYTCEKAPRITEFREAESSLFTELRFLKLNEKRHFVSHPDFSGILSYCDLISERKRKVAKLRKLNKLIEEKIRKKDVAKKAQHKIAKTLNLDFRDRVMKGGIKLLAQLNPASSLGGFVRKIVVMCVKTTGHQETLHALKGEFAKKNRDQIAQNVNNYIKNVLRPEYKKNYPDSIGAQIEKKLKNGEPLTYNENSFLRLIAKRSQLEMEKLARNEYEGLKTEISRLEKERDLLQQQIINQIKWCKPYRSFCSRIKNFSLWPTRSPATLIVVRLTTSTVQVQKGDLVIFTYSVENLGNVALSGVQITDDIPSQIQLTDKNQDTDNLLDPGETWTYQSRVNIQSSTVNQAKISGKDIVNRQLVEAKSATVNVTVLSPGTPMVTVPDLIGSTRDSAEKDLRQANLTLSRPVQTEESTQHEGLVCRQDPVSRKLVPPGSPVKIWISQERKPDVRKLFIDPPTRTIRAKNTVRLRAFIWYEDGSEEEVTERASWKGAPGGIFTADKPGTYIITASHDSYTGSAKVVVHKAILTVWDGKPPISDPEDKSARVLKPPADAYVWYVVCDKQYYDVFYTKHVDFTRHIVMEGPFPGPRGSEMWIEDNCPSWRCDTSGQCAASPVEVSPSQRGWYVTCYLPTGNIEIGKKPINYSTDKILAGPYLGEPDARLWVDQNCPSWLCDNHGGCVEDGFSELSSNVGKPKKNTKEKSEFAEIGGESTRKILRESSDATRMSHGGRKGFSLHNFDNIMGKEFRKKRATQKKEAQDFLNEFLTRTTNDFYEYQKKRVARKKLPPKTGNYQSNETGAPDKNYINNLKCKNAKPYLKNAIKAKNLKYARDVLNEIKIAKCDYYSNAKAAVDKLEKRLARQNACEHYGGKIQDDLNRRNISSAKYNLEKFKDCPNYDVARAAVVKLEDELSYTTVPNVVGMRVLGRIDSRAIDQKIKRAGLLPVERTGTHLPNLKHPDIGLVGRQHPAAGTIVKKRTRVIYYIGWSRYHGGADIWGNHSK